MYTSIDLVAFYDIETTNMGLEEIDLACCRMREGHELREIENGEHRYWYRQR